MWNDIEEMSARLASLLQALNLPVGARVAVQVEKSPTALMLYLATVRGGLVYLPLNTAYRSAEVEYFLTDAEPGVVICDSANQEWVAELGRTAGVAHIHTLNADGKGGLIDDAATHDATFRTVHSQASDMAAILYTSGTTGRSKGAMRSEEHTSELQSLMRISYAVFFLNT